jgi:hypothetical protein
MKTLDLIVTPVTLIIILTLAYLLKKYASHPETAKYFYPALLLKMVGAIGVGLIYQFYYNGGDTFTFSTHGASHIYDAFLKDFSTGFKLLTANGAYDPETYAYSSKIWTYRDESSYFVVRIAALFSLISFDTYSSIALWFAFTSFCGLWLMYQAFYKIYPELKMKLAFAIFFIPTVFFWGSGILKDTITLGAVGFLVYAFIQVFFERRNMLLHALILILSAYVVLQVKLYVLLSLLPALIIWFFLYRVGLIKNIGLKLLIGPFFIVFGAVIAIFSIQRVGQTNEKYKIDQLAKTAQVTAYDIRYWTGKDAGSGYTLGDLDGTYWSMIKLAPSAINVALFRPYIWEVNNPLMLLSALEALGLLLTTLYLFYSNKFIDIMATLKVPLILFCLTFSIIFAFAVGISTYNFGTLSRYRIVMVPFFLIAIFLIDFHAKKRPTGIGEE